MSVLETLEGLAATAASPSAEFAYIDESGNSGPISKGGTRTFTLGCVLVPLDHWTDRLDLMVECRRQVRELYGVKLRDELKANYLIGSRGPLKDANLGDGQRRDIYQRILRTTALVSSGTFAVVIDKERSAGDPTERAWEYLLQRLRIRSSSHSRPILVVPDDGDEARVRTHHRRFRRHSIAPGGKSVTAPYLIEDPIVRNSEDSYFVQAADLAAYAAFRRIQPPTRRAASVCSARMWTELTGKWMTEVTNGRSDAIVHYP